MAKQGHASFFHLPRIAGRANSVKLHVITGSEFLIKVVWLPADLGQASLEDDSDSVVSMTSRRNFLRD
jgi:hypothetical protein